MRGYLLEILLALLVTLFLITAAGIQCSARHPRTGAIPSAVPAAEAASTGPGP